MKYQNTEKLYQKGYERAQKNRKEGDEIFWNSFAEGFVEGYVSELCKGLITALNIVKECTPEFCTVEEQEELYKIIQSPIYQKMLKELPEYLATVETKEKGKGR